MSLTDINSNFFNTTVVIQRRLTTTDEVGDYTETWSDLLTDVPGTIQSVSVDENRALAQGKEYTADNKAYIPLNSSTETIKEGDRLIDTETGKTWDIKGIESFRAARKDVHVGHHFRLMLEITRKPKS